MWGTERSPFVRTALFGGTGSVAVWDLLAGAAAPPFGAVLACELEPGGSVGRHRQQELPEVVITVEGTGEAGVNGVAVPMTPGAVVHLPLGAVLSITNRSPTAPLRYLIVKAMDRAGVATPGTGS